MSEWDPYEDASHNPHVMAFRFEVIEAGRAHSEREELPIQEPEDVAEQIARWDAQSTYAPHEAEPHDPFETAFVLELSQAREAAEVEPDPESMSAEEWDAHQQARAADGPFGQPLPEPEAPPPPRDPPWPFRRDSDDYGYEPIIRDDDWGR